MRHRGLVGADESAQRAAAAACTIQPLPSGQVNGPLSSARARSEIVDAGPGRGVRRERAVVVAAGVVDVPAQIGRSRSRSGAATRASRCGRARHRVRRGPSPSGCVNRAGLAELRAMRSSKRVYCSSSRAWRPTVARAPPASGRAGTAAPAASGRASARPSGRRASSPSSSNSSRTSDLALSGTGT